MAGIKSKKRLALTELMRSIGADSATTEVLQKAREAGLWPLTYTMLYAVRAELWPETVCKRELLPWSESNESETIKGRDGLDIRYRDACPSCGPSPTRITGIYKFKDGTGRCTRSRLCMTCGHRWKTTGLYQSMRGERKQLVQSADLTERRCTTCDRMLSIDCFGFSKSKRRVAVARRSSCKSCQKRARYRLNVEKLYGLSFDDYEKTLAVQGGRCAICRTDKPFGPSGYQHPKKIREFLCVDHCHVTGRVRGLLCSRCNLAIGKFGDDITILRAAAAYIEAHRTGESP